MSFLIQWVKDGTPQVSSVSFRLCIDVCVYRLRHDLQESDQPCRGRDSCHGHGPCVTRHHSRDQRKLRLNPRYPLGFYNQLCSFVKQKRRTPSDILPGVSTGTGLKTLDPYTKECTVFPEKSTLI